MTTAGRPHRLGCNTVPVYYAGGEGIDRFRGQQVASGPEDWIGSATAFPPFLLPPGADPATGISRLEDGTLLTDAIAADPVGWLGPELAKAYGNEPGLLVKLLDAGERLPVHAHPPRDVARRHLDSRFGKTEGWIILDTTRDAVIWLGFARTVEQRELRARVDERNADAMLAAMNRLEVRAGDVYYLPAGLPHAIGPGVTLLELQEPTSFSLLAEYEPFGLDEDQATLGLGWDLALACFDLSGHEALRLGDLHPQPRRVDEGSSYSIDALFPPVAEPFFQALRVKAHGWSPIGPGGFRIAVVERGSAILRHAGGEEHVHAGETWLLGTAVAEAAVDGDCEILVCLPGRPADR